MARFSFRQGIARRQEDTLNYPSNLQPSNGGSWIDLIAYPDPTVFVVAHYDVDYMFTENSSVTKAWGPFTAGTDYWLYWDVDFVTGELTRGYTTLEPVVHHGSPPNPAVDQHWFDLKNTVMKVWTGSSWIERIRCFAAKYQQGATLIHYPKGSQVGISGSSYFAGTPLFDPDGKPLQKFSRNRRGQFITTETPLHSQFSRISNFRVEAAIVQGEAQENVPAYHAITYFDYDKIMLARNTDFANPAVGIAMEDMHTGEVRSYITKGFVTDEVNWDWSDYPVGTPLFLGASGELVGEPPISSTTFMQRIAKVINRNTIFVDIDSPISFGAITGGNIVSVQVDKTTGQFVAGPPIQPPVNPPPLDDVCTKPSPSARCTWGAVHEELAPSDTWTVFHNLNSENVYVQVYDETNSMIIPNEIVVLDLNTIIIDFGTPQVGVANVIAILPN